MRKTLFAICIVVFPLVLVYCLLTYLPMLLSESSDSSLLDKKFSSLGGNNSNSNDYSNVANNYLSRNNVEDNKSEFYYHDVRITEQTTQNTEFYDVEALDPENFEKQIVELAPLKKSTNRRSVTKVTSYIDWTLDTSQENDECKLYGAKIITNITTTLPHWVGIDDQPFEVQHSWNEFLDSVSKYETRHNHIVERISKEIAKKIRFVKKEKLCSVLINKINNIGMSGITKAENSVKRYQSETGGGRMLGVQMPSFSDDPTFERGGLK